MSRSVFFSFSHLSTGYLLHNGSAVQGNDIPTELVKAINSKQLDWIGSISMLPGGAWILAYDPNARGGPNGTSWFGANLPAKLAAYLQDTANENASNPCRRIKMGMENNFFVRREKTLYWNLTPPLQRSMAKLAAIGVQSYIDEIIFGPNDTAIFILLNGTFFWDLPPESAEDNLLLEVYKVGNSLEAAALSFTDPGEYFFFWGHGSASFRVKQQHIPRITELVNNAGTTKLQMTLMGNLMISSLVMNSQLRNQNLRQSMADYRASQSGSNDDLVVAGLVAWQGGRNAAEVAKIADRFLETGKAISSPRQGTGNLRKW